MTKILLMLALALGAAGLRWPAAVPQRRATSGRAAGARLERAVGPVAVAPVEAPSVGRSSESAVDAMRGAAEAPSPFKKLMAANHTIEEIQEYLNADSVAYLSEEGMVRATGLAKENFCMACYDGNYPVPFDPMVDKHIMERRRERTESLVQDDTQPKLL